jgi:ATP-binding cassette, subfamily F, member 3
MLLQPHNLMILDEPGNHLDIYTKEIFQRALIAYDGTLVIVSHDRFFLDTIATRIVSIEDRKIHNYMGNYSYYVQKKKDLATPSTTLNIAENSEKEGKDDKLKKTKEQKRMESEFRKKIQPYKNRVYDMEMQYEKWEMKKKEAEEMLCEKSIHDNPQALMDATQQLRESEKEMEKVIQQWELAQKEYDEVLQTKP